MSPSAIILGRHFSDQFNSNKKVENRSTYIQIFEGDDDAATGAEVATPDGEAENLAIGEGVSK